MQGDSTPSTAVRRYSGGYIAPHPSIRKDAVDVDGYLQSHQVYTAEYLASITPAHYNPQKWYEFIGLYWHVAVRSLVGLATSLLLGLLGGGGDSAGQEWELAQRIAFFAATGQVLGAAGALANHLKAWVLGRPDNGWVLGRPDNGWVHTLLMEAECARAHWGIVAAVSRPTFAARLLLLAIQAQVFLQYLLVYVLSPGVAHAYSAYRAEEQVFNFSEASKLTERGTLRKWKGRPAPEAARAYYGLPPGATLHDALLRMRADEACLAHMNHVFSHLSPCSRNPFITAAPSGTE